MRTFKDAIGREWSIDVTLKTVKDVRTATGSKVDLLAVFTPEFATLLNDPFVLVDVLFAIVAEQAVKSGITVDQFAEGMRGDAFDVASTALMEAIADFFPSRRRELLLTMLADGEKAIAEQHGQLMEMVRRQGSSDSPTDLQEPPAQIPPDSPFGS